MLPSIILTHCLKPYDTHNHLIDIQSQSLFSKPPNTETHPVIILISGKTVNDENPMNKNSYFERKEFTCPECSTPFLAKIWLIVDVEEEPGLLEKVKDGELMTAACPECGHHVDGESPLLLYFPEDVPRVILATEEKNDPSLEERAKVIEILDRLQESSEDEDILSHLDEPGDWVKKTALASRLEGYPEESLQIDEEDAYENLKNIQKENPELFLITAIEAYLNASGLENKGKVVSFAPELLTEDIDPLFERFLEEAKEEEDKWRWMIFQAQWDFLRRAREIGYKTAVDEYERDLYQEE